MMFWAPYPKPGSIYSNRKANSSRCTQYAAVAYLTDSVSSSVGRRRLRRTENKLQKQQHLLLEVVPSSDQVTFSSAYIDQEIIVFGGGNVGCPMITPPKSVVWKCHHASKLHIQDDLRGDIGLTFCRIDGCLPFIHLFIYPAILPLKSLDNMD